MSTSRWVLHTITLAEPTLRRPDAFVMSATYLWSPRQLCRPVASDIVQRARQARIPLDNTSISAAAACALQVAALRQRAALLQVYSLALLRYKLPSMLEPLLAVLVGPGSGAAATAAAAAGYSNGASAALQPYASASGTAALLALQHVCGVALPQQGIEIPAELQQIQQEMTVDDISVSALLSQPSVMESAGVVTADEYGQPVFDFAVSFVFYCTRPGL